LKDSNTDEKVVEVIVEAANGVPKKYADIANKFEKVLFAKGPSSFVKLMTQGNNPLLKISKKEMETFQKIADTAYDNPVHLATLHTFIKPSITAELADNICKARKIRAKCSLKKIADGTYKITHGGKLIEASIKPVKSTSENYTTSHYDVFGFPD